MRAAASQPVFFFPFFLSGFHIAALKRELWASPGSHMDCLDWI